MGRPLPLDFTPVESTDHKCQQCGNKAAAGGTGGKSRSRATPVAHGHVAGNVNLSPLNSSATGGAHTRLVHFS